MTVKVVDCIYGGLAIQLPNGEIWGFDIGYAWEGRHSYYPYIVKELNKVNLEGVIISHFHFNHTRGVPQIINMTKGRGIGKIYSSGAYGDGTNKYERDVKAQNELDKATDEYAIDHNIVSQGDTIETSDPDVYFECWGPNQDYSTPFEEGGHDQHEEYHLHCRLVYGDFSYFFAGDIREQNCMDSIDEMESQGWDVNSTGYYIPHHGDINYISSELVNTINPEFCHVGPLNNKDTKELLNDKNIDYKSLDDDGRWIIKGEKNGSYDLEISYGGRYENNDKIITYSRSSLTQQ